MPRGPGPVAAAHRLFIWSALVCALVYTAFELRELARTGESAVLVHVAAALVATVAIALYLRRLRTLGARLTPRA
jgi:hypothetical protein